MHHSLAMGFIVKYNTETDSWVDITSFNLDSRKGICIVSMDSFVYFLGGYVQFSVPGKTLQDADRYDLRTNTWKKLATLQKARSDAEGAAVCGKIFIAGGDSHLFSVYR